MDPQENLSPNDWGTFYSSEEDGLCANSGSHADFISVLADDVLPPLEGELGNWPNGDTSVLTAASRLEHR